MPAPEWTLAPDAGGLLSSHRRNFNIGDCRPAKLIRIKHPHRGDSGPTSGSSCRREGTLQGQAFAQERRNPSVRSSPSRTYSPGASQRSNSLPLSTYSPIRKDTPLNWQAPRAFRFDVLFFVVVDDGRSFPFGVPTWRWLSGICRSCSRAMQEPWAPGLPSEALRRRQKHERPSRSTA